MVLRKSLEKLRERPKHEQRAFAAAVAVTVVSILFVGWIIYFFRTIGNSDIDISSSTDPSGNVLDIEVRDNARQELIENLEIENNSARE
ncbi:MAG TPA: hypothetical protein VJH69_00995 [Candidatus Paceibacterota bacterium]